MIKIGPGTFNLYIYIKLKLIYNLFICTLIRSEELIGKFIGSIDISGLSIYTIIHVLVNFLSTITI